MIGSVNGVGTNFYIGSQSSRAQELDTNNTKSNIDKNSLNNLSSGLVDEQASGVSSWVTTNKSAKMR